MAPLPAAIGHDEALSKGQDGLAERGNLPQAEGAPEYAGKVQLAVSIDRGGYSLCSVLGATDLESRYRSDCRCVLHVQPLRRRARYLGSQDPPSTAGGCSNC